MDIQEEKEAFEQFKAKQIGIDYKDLKADLDDCERRFPKNRYAGWNFSNDWEVWQAAKASVVPEWQPISTAPKDKHILIKSEDGIFEAIWEKGFFVPTFAPSHGCGCCGGEDAQPTHWMELPKEPSND